MLVPCFAGPRLFVPASTRRLGLHAVRDTGLLQHINPNPAALAAELESRIIPQDMAEWQKGSIEDWVMEGRRLAQTVAYGDLSNENPAPITPAYEQKADPVIELQLEKAGVRLAYPSVITCEPAIYDHLKSGHVNSPCRGGSA